ncbi:MAG TPA: extracellular solute-binding protein [Nitrososphaeraceae archaeon]
MFVVTFLVIRNDLVPKIVVVTILATMIILSTISVTFDTESVLAQQHNKEQVTLRAILSAPRDRWDILLKDALDELRSRHPEMNIQLNYTVFPYNVTRAQILRTLGNKTSIDLVSVDQIWLGDFAQRRYLTDLTDNVSKWGKYSDWYQTNLDGSLYKGRVYGIWAWTDVRAIWYWKDLLNQTGVDPNMLKTWEGYITSLNKINNIFKHQNRETQRGGVVVCGGAEWYPYLWMLGGDILTEKHGHPTKGTYWFPAYNSSAGVRAAEFVKQQVGAGIKPILSNVSGFENDFINKKIAVLIGGSWLPGIFPPSQREDLEKIVGFIPMYPVPSADNQTTTLLGGWELGIPQSSKHKDLAWELITIMVDPKILAHMLAQTGYLPTQKTIGEGPQSAELNQTIPYYDKMVSMIPIGHSRPSVPEFPQIDNDVSQALDQVCLGLKNPKQALNDASAKSAKVLGW